MNLRQIAGLISLLLTACAPENNAICGKWVDASGNQLLISRKNILAYRIIASPASRATESVTMPFELPSSNELISVIQRLCNGWVVLNDNTLICRKGLIRNAVELSYNSATETLEVQVPNVPVINIYHKD